MEDLNEILKERYELSCIRINEIRDSQETVQDFKEYFERTAAFILDVVAVFENDHDNKDIDELRKENKAIYSDIIGGNYETSYANPAFACSKLGDEYGRILSFLYSEIRAMIPYAFEKKLEDMVIRMELFVEIYSDFEYAYAETKQSPNSDELKETLYWFVSDYSETAVADRVKTQVDAEDNFAVKIIMDNDINDIRYLYKYGEYVSPEVEKMAEYLNGLNEERIQMIADTYTEGYRIGFIKGNKDLSKKEVVDIRYMLGFERIVKAAIANFEKMGLKPTISRASNSIFHKKGVNKVGYFGADANKQYVYDHKDDIALFFDKKLMNRKLEVLKTAYDEVEDKACKYAGPAVIEVFGETPFAPVIKSEALSLSPEQQKLMAEYNGLSADVVDKYIHGDERSFTIIAFPVPDIGDRFAEIFDETVKLNTLDYKTYECIQATIIDALNKAQYVEIKGMNGNKTNLRVELYKLNNPDKETIFENCVADVNIPVGEVFTSPVLEGTNGKLHVSRVFLNELEYKNLEVDFKDGMVSDYTCTNFDSEDKNKAYIKENVLYNHETLPMGEFAIGTNTTAYMTAKKYDIASLFPILIAEKTGPHFAVGDTCYSRCEDVAVYNEDGKEIVARDNSVSILRKTDPQKAYFACHTDITIPYDELGSIIAYGKDGESYEIILNGRFVLEGTGKLNEAFDI
jgi:leucyl aminopeptidase (aminopeptidase T)